MSTIFKNSKVKNSFLLLLLFMSVPFAHASSNGGNAQAGIDLGSLFAGLAGGAAVVWGYIWATKPSAEGPKPDESTVALVQTARADRRPSVMVVPLPANTSGDATTEDGTGQDGISDVMLFPKGHSNLRPLSMMLQPSANPRLLKDKTELAVKQLAGIAYFFNEHQKALQSDYTIQSKKLFLDRMSVLLNKMVQGNVDEFVLLQNDQGFIVTDVQNVLGGISFPVNSATVEMIRNALVRNIGIMKNPRFDLDNDVVVLPNIATLVHEQIIPLIIPPIDVSALLASPENKEE